MPDAARQLVFDLPVQPRFGIDDFLVSASNEAAYLAIEAWPDWANPVLHLRGPAGSGKSHLAAIWAARAEAATVQAAAVTADRVPDLAEGPALVVEDIDRGDRDERALFHLVNRARERGMHLLLTSIAPVERCGIAVPDLLSRLRLARSLELGPPDDALLKAVLVKLFVDRQLVVDVSVVEYIATRMERSLAEALAIVAELDREALSRGRRVTRPVAAAIMAPRGDGPVEDALHRDA